MAYIDDLQDQQQQNKAQASGIIAGSGGQVSGSNPQSTAGTGFTNLQTYLKANEGNGASMAQDIVSEGQKGVSKAQEQADSYAKTWADTGAQKANQAGQDGASSYNDAATRLNTNAWDIPENAPSGSYGGPKTAQDIPGYNDLDKAYQNVKDTASSYANNYDAQKAALQSKHGYGSGFAGLDTFLARQDGKGQIQGWANGVNPGSAQGQIDRVNAAIGAGQQQVADAQSAYQTANANAHKARVGNATTSVATPTPAPTTSAPSSSGTKGGLIYSGDDGTVNVSKPKPKPVVNKSTSKKYYDK